MSLSGDLLVSGRFEIAGALPGMNEIIAANRSHWARGAKQKKAWTQAVVLMIRTARATGDLPHRTLRSPVAIRFSWVEAKKSRQKMRDPDNIMAAQKFILDAMVAEKVIANDRLEDICAIQHDWTIGEGPGCSVEVVELPRVK